MRVSSPYAVLLLATIGVGSPLAAQNDELEAEIAAWYQAGLDLWNAADVDAIVSAGASMAGFGYRGLAPRGTADPTAGWPKAALDRFFEPMEYFRATVEEVHAQAYGNVVVAWGFFTEDFKRQGSDPEVYTIRFSMTLLRDTEGGLRQVLAHRDIQSFDENGRYIPRSQ